MYAMRTKKFMEHNLLKIPFRRILKLTTLFSRTLEPAQPTNDCPHQYVMFRSGGGGDGCSQFTNCVASRCGTRPLLPRRFGLQCRQFAVRLARSGPRL
jgi:hypothetical protein